MSPVVGLDEVRANHGLTTVVKAIRVMQAFSYSEPVLGVSELSRRLEMGKSTVHRILTTLVDEGFVQRTSDNRYRLGLRLYELGQVVVAGLELREVAHVPLERLRTQSGETAHLAVLEVPDVVYLERFESPSTLRLFSRLGRRSHAHATSSGKCLLAFGSQDDFATVIASGLPRVAPRTITTPRLLANALADIREKGYVVSVEESEKGVVSVGAPVFGHTGACIAAVSVAGPIMRMPPDNLDRFINLVTATAASISRSMGFRAGREVV